MAKKVGNPGLKGKLVEKSIESYILSLETINRLSAKYRIESFTYLICNSWELLLKAKIISDSGDKSSIYYKKVKGKNQRSLALRDCLNKVFPHENDPIRRNIECIADLRDEVVHLVISTIPKDILALFQACVLNYHKKLIEWFNTSLSERIPIGMMTIVYDLSPDQLDLNSSILRKKLGSDATNYLLKVQTNLKQNFESLDKSAEFSIDINYKLAFVKNVKDSDIAMVLGNIGDIVGTIGIPKESGKTHPYRQKESIEQVNILLAGSTLITMHYFQCIINVYNIKKRPEFYYCGTVPGSPKQYSQAFVEWVVAQYNANNNFFQEVKEKVRTIKIASNIQLGANS